MTLPIESALLNKSELIRKVFRERPAASNAEIRLSIKQRWNVDVEANLIIQAIGRERDRVAYLASHASLQKLAKKFLGDCGGNIAIAINHLRLAY
jgi:hypothetical protein